MSFIRARWCYLGIAVSVLGCAITVDDRAPARRGAEHTWRVAAGDLHVGDPERPADMAPAVAIMVFSNSQLVVVDGHVKIPIRSIDDVLTCDAGDQECAVFRQTHRDDLIPEYDGFCTVAFIDEQTIITASHCIRSSHWSRGYVILDHLRDARVDGNFATIPASRVARLQCLGQSRNDEEHGAEIDWAIISVAPLQDELAPHQSLTLSPSAPDAPITVQSHMLGLRLLESAAELTTDPNLLRFSTAGGGSGAPVLQNGDIVGVVRGRDPCKGRSCLCDQDDIKCWQPITWSEFILHQNPPPQQFDHPVPRCEIKDSKP